MHKPSRPKKGTMPLPRSYHPKQIERGGFKPTGKLFDQVPAYPTQRRLAIELGYAVAALAYFRHPDGKWGLWIRPDAKQGFEDQGPLLE